jgi:hypothetical protein
MNFQLLNLLRIFDFFAAFVRSLLEIVGDSAQIGSMLAFVVLTLSFLFYVLDLNSEEPAYTGDDTVTTAFIGYFTVVI